MVDITEISAIVAALGVLVGVILTVQELRHQTLTRRTDLVWRMSQTLYADDYREAILKVLNLDFKDYNDFVRKYGPYLSENTTMKAITKINVLYEGLGNLIEKRLIDPKLVYSVFGTASCRAWEKVRLIIEGFRKAQNSPDYLYGFEYLYNEMKKIGETRGVKIG
jgi:hypothetical protein